MSLWDNEAVEPWDKNVPSELITAIKHLRDSFDTMHCMAGLLTTMPVCYLQLHENVGKWGSTDVKQQQEGYAQLLKLSSSATEKRFQQRMAQGTLPAIFAAFFGAYLEIVMAEALRVFNEFVKIGLANITRLNVSHLEWAESQTKHLIRSHRHTVQIWIREVCDDTFHEPIASGADVDPFETYWNTWRAPAFLIMKPSRFGRYEPAKVWERVDHATSREWLEMFADHYVRILESEVGDEAGDAAVELAKQPKPFGGASTENQIQPQQAPLHKPEPLESENLDVQVIRRAALLERLRNAKPEGCLRTSEAAIVLDVSNRTINRKVKDRELTSGPTRGTVTANSLKKIYEALFGKIE